MHLTLVLETIQDFFFKLELKPHKDLKCKHKSTNYVNTKWAVAVLNNQTYGSSTLLEIIIFSLYHNQSYQNYEQLSERLQILISKSFFIFETQ